MNRKIIQFGFEVEGSEGSLESSLWVLDDKGQLWFWHKPYHRDNYWKKAPIPALPEIEQ